MRPSESPNCRLAAYLENGLHASPTGVAQQRWFRALRDRVGEGAATYMDNPPETRRMIESEFQNRVRTEEIKAWYGSPEGDSVFQGTSISSLTIPFEVESPLRFGCPADLEDAIANAYVELHDRLVPRVREAVAEDVEEWFRMGLFYGVVIASKVLSQTFRLHVPQEQVVFDVAGVRVDPHEILRYPNDIREEYFEESKKRIGCFDALDLTREELEASLALADISKPRLESLKGQILLAPPRCNELAALMAGHVGDRIREKTGGRIAPKSLAVVIYDSDTPYTYHRICSENGGSPSPVLPGITVLGSSGSISSFRWLYAYRVSLVAQKIMKGSLYSEVHRKFIPFVFFGVLVPRDAEILLEMDHLNLLRYRGNLSPQIEFAYLVPELAGGLSHRGSSTVLENLERRTK